MRPFSPHNMSMPSASKHIFVGATWTELKRLGSLCCDHQTICRLPRTASEGIDGINTHLLQLSLPITLPYIRHVFNTSIATNSFPSLWKKAIITPIYKEKGSQSEPGNYRPVAILPVMSCVLEKLILNQVFAYMDQHSILAGCQYAFRKIQSTETALLEVTDQIWTGMDKQQVTADVLVDQPKAFDKVDRKILLDKMTKCGIYCDWFRSYLTAKFRAVQQDDTLSNILNVNIITCFRYLFLPVTA